MRGVFLVVLASLLCLCTAYSDESAQTPSPKSNLDLLKEQLRDKAALLQMELQNPKQKISVSEIANAALCKLTLNHEDDQAGPLLQKVFAVENQDVHSAQYGMFPRVVSGSGTPIDGDINATEFTAQALIAVVNLYSSDLTLELSRGVKGHFRAALAAISRHHVPLSSTNMFLTNLSNQILLADFLNEAQTLKVAVDSLKSWLDFTNLHGIPEFTSATNGALDMAALSYGFLFTKNANLKALFKKGMDFLWLDLAAHFFPGTGQISGPHSRDYNFFESSGGVDIYTALWGWRTFPADSHIDLGKISAVINQEHGGYSPSADIVRLSELPLKIVLQRGLERGQDRTDYITSNFAIGSTSKDYSPYDRVVEAQLKNTKNLSPVSVVANNTSDYYGMLKVKSGDGFAKSTHLRSMPTCAQWREKVVCQFSVYNDAKSPNSKLLSTSILLPANAESLTINDRHLHLEENQQRKMGKGDVLTIAEGNSAISLRVLSVHSLCPQTKNQDEYVKLDKEGEKINVLRMTINHPCGAHVALALWAHDASESERALRELKRAKIIETFQKDMWLFQARFGQTQFSLAQNFKTGQMLSRKIDNKELVFPIFTVNGENVAPAIPK